MVVSKRSWFYRAWLATFDAEHPVPATTSLCPMFWRVVLFYGAFLICVAWGGYAVCVFVGALFHGVTHWRDVLQWLAALTIGAVAWHALLVACMFAMLAAIFGVVAAIYHGIRSVWAWAQGMTPPGSVIGAMLRAWWRRVCPLVTFTDEANR